MKLNALRKQGAPASCFFKKIGSVVEK